jgi:outer membrane protein assembly factor BamA
VAYQGAHHLKREDLARITGLREGEPVNSRANRRACRAIEAHYHKLGRLYASAELAEGGRPGETRVVIVICEGPVVKPDVVEFDGNTFVSAKRLALQIKSSALCKASPRPKFAPDVADADARALSDYYRAFGFRDVQVSWDLAWADDAKRVRLLFHVHEGQRYPCGQKERPPTGPVNIHVGRIEPLLALGTR